MVPVNLGLITGYLVWGPGYQVRVPGYLSLTLVTLVWSLSTEHILKNDMFDQNVIVQERQKTVFRPTDNSFLFEHKIWMKEGYFPDKLILITGKINRVKSL